MAAAHRYGSRRERFRWIPSHTDPGNPELERLTRDMRRYYAAAGAQQDYYHIAAQGKEDWAAAAQHRVVLDALRPGARVVEFGCGSALGAPHFAARGARYVGFDLAPSTVRPRLGTPGVEGLLVADGARVPLKDGCADAVVSYYSIEHVVHPSRYIDEMVRLVRPGGFVALAFPEYLANPHRVLESFRMGRSPGRIPEKVRGGRLWDAAQSLYELWSAYPRHVRRMRRLARRGDFRFWINTAPRCLVQPYYPDSDAVYFSSEIEIGAYLERKGLAVEMRMRDTEPDPKADLRGMGFVLARAPHR